MDFVQEELCKDKKNVNSIATYDGRQLMILYYAFFASVVHTVGIFPGFCYMHRFKIDQKLTILLAFKVLDRKNKQEKIPLWNG